MDESQDTPEEVANIVAGRPLMIQMWQWAWQEFVIDKKPRCINEARHACYRNKEGCFCPLGRHMPMVLELSAWENMLAIGKLMHRRQDVADCFRGIRIGVLIEFQRCHDCDEFNKYAEQLKPVHVAIGLKKFAIKYKLEVV